MLLFLCFCHMLILHVLQYICTIPLLSCKYGCAHDVCPYFQSIIAASGKEGERFTTNSSCVYFTVSTKSNFGINKTKGSKKKNNHYTMKS